MSVPITTLSDIVTLAQQQYGIRFQLKPSQMVSFANMIQHIAFNQDISAFEEHGQVLVLGQDCLLETDGATYIAPTSTDILKPVIANGVTTVGTLLNYNTRNRRNVWIIEPPDGGTNFTLTAGDILTISGGTGATGVVCTGQTFPVSNGPYRVPSVAAGNPPFRKLIGLTQVTDSQMFLNTPGTSTSDYGLENLDNIQDSRFQNYPYRFDIKNQELWLVSDTRPEITQTTDLCGSGGTTLNTSNIRWIYYKNPYPIETISDESALQLPEEYRYEILYGGITALADVAVYGETVNIRQIIEPMCERFWEDMRAQYQQYGRNSDFISHGDNIYGDGYRSM